MTKLRPSDLYDIPHGTRVLLHVPGQRVLRECVVKHVDGQGAARITHVFLMHGPVPAFGGDWPNSVHVEIP